MQNEDDADGERYTGADCECHLLNHCIGERADDVDGEALVGGLGVVNGDLG